MISHDARRKLVEIRERNRQERGRDLTPTEQLANLSRAIARTCRHCGSEVELREQCHMCGNVNQ